MAGRILKFKTKLVIHDDGTYDLYLPNGQLVARGSRKFVSEERDRWEDVLSEPQQLTLNFTD